MRRFRHTVAIVVVSALAAWTGRRPEGREPVGEAVGTAGHGDQQAPVTTVADVVDAARPPSFVAGDKDSARLWALTKQFYQKRENAAAWIDGTKPRSQMDDLVRVLQHVDRDGLDPTLYDAATLAARREEAGRGFL